MPWASGVHPAWQGAGFFGWMRSSEEGMKTGDAVFMPGGVFAAGRGLASLGVCTELRTRTRPGTSSPVSYLISCFSYWTVPPLIEDG